LQNRHDEKDFDDDALPPPSFVIRTMLVEEEQQQKQQERQARENEPDALRTHTHLSAQAPAGGRGRTQSHYDPGSLYYVEESNFSTSNPGGAGERLQQEEKERAEMDRTKQQAEATRGQGEAEGKHRQGTVQHGQAETHQQKYHHEHQEANQHRQRSNAMDENLPEIVERQQREFEQKIAAERAKMEAELAAAQSAQREAEEKARILNNILHEESRKTTPAPPLRTQAEAVTLHAGVDCVIVDLILKMDFSETVGREKEYKSGVAADMASAVGCNPNKIRVQVSITCHIHWQVRIKHHKEVITMAFACSVRCPFVCLIHFFL
jgi:hypothetical protein